MQDVCDKFFTLSAEEMLAKAKASAGTERTITMKSTKKKGIIKIFGIAAACAVISGTAVTAMGYGPLGESFRKLFEVDKTTEKIMEEGHSAEIGLEQSADVFKIEIVSVTGDEMYPKLFLDVTVNDETLAANNDSLQLFAYILDEDTYRNHLEEYGMWEGEGVKDAEVSNLYHICMNGPSAFMVNEQEVIALVRKIHFDNDPEKAQYDYAVNMEYRFTVPRTALKQSVAKYYDNITIKSRELDYDLEYAEFGSYESLFYFTFDFLGTSLANGATDYDHYVNERFDDYWNDFVKDFVLTVGGTDYKPQEIGSSYYVDDDAALGSKRCSTWMSFPAIDYANAELITLTAGGQTYTIKDGKDEPDDSIEACQHYDTYSDIIFSSDSVDYELNMAGYFSDEVILEFKYDFRKSVLAGGETDYHNYDSVSGAFDADWEKFADKFVLTVDGTEYSPSTKGRGYCYQEGEYLEPGMCGTILYFPGFDYDSASQIKLTAGDMTVVLKGDSAEASSVAVTQDSVQETTTEAATDAVTQDSVQETTTEAEIETGAKDAGSV